MQNRKITTNYNLFSFISVFCGIILICSCQSTEKTNPNIIQFSEAEYENVVENYSAQAQEYDGLQNTIEFSATLLNSSIIEAQTLRKATMLQWEKSEYDQELTTRIAKSKETTDVFISFYTPDRKNSDLARSTTLWKIFLISKEKRYEGKAEKVTLLNAEIQSLYPQHNKWSNAYLIKFPIALSKIEDQESELIITGPVGTKSIHFKALTK